MKGSNNVLRLKVRLHGQDVKEIALESGREYTFGRGADCDVQLEDQPGISRVHFKVHDDGSGWVAQVVSKFGDINVAGSPVQNVKLELGTVFKLSGYDFLFFEQQSAVVTPIRNEDEVANHSVSEMPIAVGQSERSHANLPAPLQTPAFEGSDEATRVMDIVTTGDPYVRIVEASGREETIKLEGRKWIAGREDGSQILLNDRKASRRQFELVASPQGNFVRDLGSSNGTQLNGMPLAPDELKPMRSGDVIQVGALQIYFEVRDPHFERRLQVVPKEVLQTQMPVAQQVSYEMINYPVTQGPGGAVRVNSAGVPASYEAPAWDQARDAKAARTKKFRFILICALVLAPVIYFLSNDQKPQKVVNKEGSSLSPQMQAFAKLTPQKQQFVKEAYILGHNLYIQGKTAMASVQFAKIHELLKDGYQDSLALAKECEDQHLQEQNRLDVERQMKEAAQNKVIVIENLAKCKPIAMRTYDESDLRSCLAPTYELEPENPTIGDYKRMVEERVALRDAKNANARTYSLKVARGRELFKKADEIEKRGDSEGAVDAYRAHLAANLPDPDHLREISKKKVGIIEGNKSASISGYLSAAETALVNHDYKTAINNINKVKGLDQFNQAAAELNGRINREKDQILRGIYEDSILNEGLGQIDQAKVNWKKIMEMDHPDGTYYKRAKNKMRSLGGQ
jgi:pSer/pThr/pTyr-binding forkhead associated (FHA) protein